MKTTIFAIVLLLSWILLSQDIDAQNFVEDNFPNEGGKIIYQGVVTVDSTLSAEDLHLNAKEWVIETFRSAEDVIVSDDKEANLIIAKGYIAKGHNSFIKNPQNWFTLKLEMKDGRYRYTLYDIIYEFYVSYDGVTKDFREPLEQWLEAPIKSTGKKREKVVAGMNKYCQELDAEFKATLISLENRMRKVRADEW